jgi:triosephosphate isomerase
MARRFFVGGNWKMNGDKASIDGIVTFLNQSGGNPNVDIVVAPPAPYLVYVKEAIKAEIQVAAQNCYKVIPGSPTLC